MPYAMEHYNFAALSAMKVFQLIIPASELESIIVSQVAPRTMTVLDTRSSRASFLCSPSRLVVDFMCWLTARDNAVRCCRTEIAVAVETLSASAVGVQETIKRSLGEESLALLCGSQESTEAWITHIEHVPKCPRRHCQMPKVLASRFASDARVWWHDAVNKFTCIDLLKVQAIRFRAELSHIERLQDSWRDLRRRLHHELTTALWPVWAFAQTLRDWIRLWDDVGERLLALSGTPTQEHIAEVMKQVREILTNIERLLAPFGVEESALLDTCLCK